MKKLFSFLAGILMLAAIKANAQFPYSFSAFKEAYAPLSGATIFYPNYIWNGYFDNFIVSTGFNFKIDTFHCNIFYSQGGNSLITDTSNLITGSGFFLSEISLADRGILNNINSLSPVGYEVSGNPGNRIFKMEILNAGFPYEKIKYGTMNDSVNFQIWLYEGSNIIEIHYGTSQISHSNEYFSHGSGPLVSFVQNVDQYGNGTLYSLSGDPLSPALQTVIFVNGSPQSTIHSLISWPHDSTIYRFTPVAAPSSVTQLPGDDHVLVYPTFCSDKITVELQNNTGTKYIIRSINGSSTNISGLLNHEKTSIDVNSLVPGIYLLHLQNSECRTVKKFIKE